ncbi:DinB family protein [Egicoccus sp. AB-alg2]|uniref:mycothiol transferase n=1 Tax=Egicoccus sp. AB-alg2 TaxID=3242693 RepID=UPI00359E6F2F
MDTRELLTDAFHRIPELTRSLTDGAGSELLHYRPDRDANPIAWLLWHAARVQDDHVAALAGREQVWTAQGWMERFDLPFDPQDIGYGQSSEEVGQVRVEDPSLVVGYQDAVTAMVDEYLATVDDQELGRVVDDAWDPPVTAGVRLVSVIGDVMQHLGQAGYVRGLYERRG